MTTAKLTASKH